MARRKPDTVKSATPAFQAILNRGELPAGTQTAGDIARNMSDATRYGYQPPLPTRPRPTAPAGKGGGGAQKTRTRASSPTTTGSVPKRTSTRPADVLPGPSSEQGRRGPFGPYDEWPDRDPLKPAWPLPGEEEVVPRLRPSNPPGFNVLAGNEPPLDAATLDRFNDPTMPPPAPQGNPFPPVAPNLSIPRPPMQPSPPAPQAMMRAPQPPQPPPLATTGNPMVARPPAPSQGPGMMASIATQPGIMANAIGNQIGAGQGMPPGLLDSIRQMFGGQR